MGLCVSVEASFVEHLFEKASGNLLVSFLITGLLRLCGPPHPQHQYHRRTFAHTILLVREPLRVQIPRNRQSRISESPRHLETVTCVTLIKKEFRMARPPNPGIRARLRDQAVDSWESEHGEAHEQGGSYA